MPIRTALPALIEASGAIVVVSSLAGLFAAPQTAGYTVGKHALIGLVKSLARDYGRHGIRVNARAQAGFALPWPTPKWTC